MLFFTSLKLSSSLLIISLILFCVNYYFQDFINNNTSTIRACCFSVVIFYPFAFFCFSVKYILNFVLNQILIFSAKHICPVFNSYRSFSIFSER